MTPFQKKVLTKMADGLNHGGCYFAYACGVENKGKHGPAGRFINGYMSRLIKNGWVTKVYTPANTVSKFRITDKGLKLMEEENKTLFDVKDDK